MKLKGKKILVTGADGFIGSHLTEALAAQGHDVRAFVFYNSFNSWGWLDHSSPKIQKALEVFSGDIRDPFFVAKAVKDCDVVFHLAALIAIPYSYHAPESYVDTNVKGTLHVLEACRKEGVQKVVHTSTSETYGTAQFVPITENHPLEAQSPYAASKTGADQMALAYHRSFGTPVAVLRPFNTYGPRQSARAVIPTIITQIASGKKEIRLGSLTPTRDFNYVKDTVTGFTACAESESSAGEVINLGSDYEISIGDTVSLIAEVMKKKVRVVSEKARVRPGQSEVERLWASNDKAKRLLGWEPAYGQKDGFRRGLAETVKWFTQKENLKRYKTDAYNL